MALTRKFLAAMGIEPEKIDEIIDAHTETVDALKKERDGYRVDAEKLTGVQQELDDLKKQKPTEDYKKKYDDLKIEYDGYKADVAAKETSAKKQAAYRKLLEKAGVSKKRIDSVIRVSDVDGVELDDSGEIKDSDSKIESIKKEWSDFIVKNETHGASTPKPPKATGGGGDDGKSRAAEVAAKYYQNLYGGDKE